ncbi:mandelate racemase/muconate lactonizing enzyme family protein [Brachybacterium sacelli]|uniref:glucarate dehydratase n=1 Tax=Brachybacterium sacelli TaxID=173364 RepID=A0ABS4X1M6_9MICO|nr:enolase C-terminal domain-like protein [Brachybacterium sacelli]MBP2381639.1 L-alanine-DL-glutamate epimerase-like enolase superfamily enzyme [Brachybacterium sacelli]
MNALSGHRISEVTSTPLRSRYPRTIGRNARLGAHGDGPTAWAVTVRTEDGASGWGMAEGPESDPATLVGRPLEEVIDPDHGVLDPAALPLDAALHDLAARLLGVPVHVMLGGHGVTPVTCYSGAIYFEDLDPEEAPRGIDGVLASCAADWASGYRAFKLKIGRGNLWMTPEAGFARDVEVTRAVREAYPAARVLVDMNDGYDPERSVRYLEAVADCDLFWIEEPFAEHAEGLRRVREHRRRPGSPVLVADGEFEPDLEEVLDLARDGLLDVLLMDVLSIGITAWRHLMPTVREIGVAASPHAWGHPLKTLYAAQLAAGLGNVPVVEAVPGTTDGVDASGYTLVDGRLTLPDAPGFGLGPRLTAAGH